MLNSQSPHEIIGDDSDKGGHRAYGLFPLMASSSGGQVGALCAESFGERILSEDNDVRRAGETLREEVYSFRY